MKRHYQLILALAIFVSGCSGRYLAEYDEIVGRGAANLQFRFNALFDDLQRTAGTPAGDYEHYSEQYRELYVHVADLQWHAALQLRNDLTRTSLSLLDDNLHALEAAHREGLSAGEVPLLRKLFDAQLRALVQLEVAKKREPQTTAGVTR